ncbi:MAG: hypothetical protein AAGF76_08910 [Pseudomonadota bacterium]
MGGKNIGGSFRARFQEEDEASNFQEFLNSARSVVLEQDIFDEAQDLNLSVGTNGGANRFHTSGVATGADTILFKINGADVSGQDKFDDISDYIARAAELYGGANIRTGTFSDSILDSRDGELPDATVIERSDGSFRAQLKKPQGNDLSGQFSADFGSTSQARNFADFLDEMAQFVENEDLLV